MSDDAMMLFMDAMLYAMEGESPSRAIENYEKRGQRELVRRKQLPKRINDTSDLVRKAIREMKLNLDTKDFDERFKATRQVNERITREQYERMGIKIVEESDELLYDVELPEGWDIVSTDHSMWNNLIDDKGRERASFFYKASFYDRDAFINFNTRYHYSVERDCPAGAGYEEWSKADIFGAVKRDKDIIYSTEKFPSSSSSDVAERKLLSDLEEYMNKHYPNHKDINAYWD
jgi:hypothetical protein